jgi:hypothetical protein
LAVKKEDKVFKSYISERYPFLSVGGLLRFSAGYYKAKNAQEEEWIENLDAFKTGQIRYAKDGERVSASASAPRHRRGARSTLSMRGEL